MSSKSNKVIQFTVNVLKGADLAIKDKPKKGQEEGSSDPFVVVCLVDRKGKTSQSQKTPVVKKNLNPVFQLGAPFKFEFDCDTHRQLNVRCWDKDTFGKDFMGEIVFSLRQIADAAKTGGEQWYELLSRPGENDIVKGKLLLHIEMVSPSVDTLLSQLSAETNLTASSGVLWRISSENLPKPKAERKLKKYVSKNFTRSATENLLSSVPCSFAVPSECRSVPGYLMITGGSQANFVSDKSEKKKFHQEIPYAAIKDIVTADDISDEALRLTLDEHGDQPSQQIVLDSFHDRNAVLEQVSAHMKTKPSQTSSSSKSTRRRSSRSKRKRLSRRLSKRKSKSDRKSSIDDGSDRTTTSNDDFSVVSDSSSSDDDQMIILDNTNDLSKNDDGVTTNEKKSSENKSSENTDSSTRRRKKRLSRKISGKDKKMLSSTKVDTTEKKIDTTEKKIDTTEKKIKTTPKKLQRNSIATDTPASSSSNVVNNLNKDLGEGEIRCEFSWDKHKQLLSVQLIEARQLTAKDKNGLSDPFVKCYIDDKKLFSSAVHKKTLNPTFDENFQVSLPHHVKNIDSINQLRLEVWDQDKFSSNDFIGSVSFDFHKEIVAPGERSARWDTLFNHRQKSSRHRPFKKALSTMKHLKKSSSSSSSNASRVSTDSAPSALENTNSAKLKSSIDEKASKHENKNDDDQAASSAADTKEDDPLMSPFGPCLAPQEIVRAVGFAGKMHAYFQFVERSQLDSAERQLWAANSTPGVERPAAGLLKVFIDQCESLLAKDRNGLSDPFIKLSIEHQVKETRVIKKNLSPVFNESKYFSLYNPDQATLFIEIYDWDKFTSDDLIGRAHLKVSELGTQKQVHNFWITVGSESDEEKRLRHQAKKQRKLLLKKEEKMQKQASTSSQTRQHEQDTDELFAAETRSRIERKRQERAATDISKHSWEEVRRKKAKQEEEAKKARAKRIDAYRKKNLKAVQEHFAQPTSFSPKDYPISIAIIIILIIFAVLF